VIVPALSSLSLLLLTLQPGTPSPVAAPQREALAVAPRAGQGADAPAPPHRSEPAATPDGPAGPPSQDESLRAVPRSLFFGARRLLPDLGPGDRPPADPVLPGPPTVVHVSNETAVPLQIVTLDLEGAAASDFRLVLDTALPIALAPGAGFDVELRFKPTARGLRRAQLLVESDLPEAWPQRVRLRGIGVGPVGEELRVNCGGDALVATNGDDWAAEYGARDGSAIAGGGSVEGTTDDALFTAQRRGASFAYHWLLPEPSTCRVTLSFAELEHEADGLRAFDVLLEGEPVFDGLDVHALAGARTALELETDVDCTDGVLDLEFEGKLGEAMVSAVRVYSRPLLVPDAESLNFGAVAAGGQATLPLVVHNGGLTALRMDTLRVLLGGSGTGQAFTVDFEGQSYPGAPSNVSYAIDSIVGAGRSKSLQVTFAPAVEQYSSVILRLEWDGGQLDVPMSGLGGHEGDPYLHVVIQTDDYVVDYDAAGSATVVLDGTSSHTHEPGHALTGYEWSEGGVPFSSAPVATPSLPLGPHDVALEITDDNVPPRVLTGEAHVDVLGTDEVPGVLVRYYDPLPPDTAVTLLDAVPSQADYAELLEGFSVAGATSVGGSPFAADVMVRLNAGISVENAGTYSFLVAGGAAHRIELDGSPVLGPLVLSPGVHQLEVRFAVDDLLDLPLEVELSDGGPFAPIDPSLLTHDETNLGPVINAMPGEGGVLGGNLIVIRGVGFFPASEVVVHWDTQDLTEVDFDALSPTEIRFLSPPHVAATIDVNVETGKGSSNVRQFIYDADGPVPVNFQSLAPITNVPQPTAAAFGPDGRFYVASLDGRLTVIEFDDGYGVVSKTIHAGVSNLSNHDVLGLAFDPYDPGTPVRVYVGHGKHFVNGGSSFIGPSPYTGQISVLTGPSFNAPTPVVTGLPCSNHDHGVNGMAFDDNGDLLVSIGSMTNAGVRHPNSGDLPESPLSAAIVKVRLSDPDFNGTITYRDSETGLPNNDQVYGETVDVAPGVDVEVHAPGLRNAFDLVYTTQGLLYATDNGPNIGFGAASTGPDTEAPDPYDVDELNLIERGNYYGHPNRSRGRTDPRQYVYYGQAGDDIPEVLTQPILALVSSTDGVDESRSATFGGQVRGQLVLHKWVGNTSLMALSEDGRFSEGYSNIVPYTGALSGRAGPGGALLTLDWGNNRVVVLKPVDQSATGLVVQDITPWRAPATGGTPFVVAGVGFGSLANTSVTIGGIPATLTSVSSTRIRGTIPANVGPTTDLLDVIVDVSGTFDVLQGAFRYLIGKGEEPGRWRSLDPIPSALGEVAAGVLDGILVLVGEGTPSTYRYDLIERRWLPSASFRPQVGHHHAAEVVGGKLYLIGGLGGNSEGKVQIFDPTTGSWSNGAPMSWAAGSVSTAVIGGKIYAAGGIVGANTVTNCAVYDPATNSWSPRAPMPVGRNHAAGGTDGTRFFVFGGRSAGNFVTNGFAEVQIYDPATDTWESSSDAGSSLVPLPQARGGMGRALYYRGEFYVIGGETLNGPGAQPGNVYDRVDVYDPLANSWRLEAPLPTARHGLYPVQFQGHVFLAGGGTHSGNAQSTVFETFTRQ